MRRLINLSLLIGLVLLILVGCGNGVMRDEKTAEQYVEQQGYKVISHNGEVQKYVLDKSKLYGSTETTPYRQSWAVQTVGPDQYFGKEITVYGFTVKNHPLEKIYKRKTNVFIMICEGKGIGGTSFPVQGKEILAGAPYSLDGKTLEEVTGLTYKEWSENWKRKYGN